MKLSAKDAARTFARWDPDRPGLLISGADPMRVATRRKDAVVALAGPQAESEMRLTRLPAEAVRRDPAALTDALRAIGFFPGPRAVVLEDATDGMTDTVAAALSGWRPGDAVLVVTAGDLKPRSALRRLFEDHPRAFALVLYDDPPTPQEIATDLATAGLRGIPDEAMATLSDLARALDPADFRQTLEKLALYKLGDPAPVTPEDIAACAPALIEAATDDLLHSTATGDTAAIPGLMRRVEGRGSGGAVALAILALRHFRTLHAAACDPGGPASGLARARPPVAGPRRDRLLRQLQSWDRERLETGLALLVETDLTLRSASRVPGTALMERTFIRLSRLARRRQADPRGGRA